MVLALLQLAAAVTPGDGPRRAFVRVEGPSVYVFTDQKASLAYDSDACVTAVALSHRQMRILRGASRRGTAVEIRVIVHPDYFNRRGFGGEYHLNWNFHGQPVNPLCESTTLFEIVDVHRSRSPERRTE
ncbi:MAG: hypothetical protein QOK17_455 [Sphingomonadales bacterium]|jgi:hypothetical protein|nr:hypothetical protein [Sphingomonadales bacterium]